MKEIQRAQNSFISEYQPLIFDDDISKLLSENNLSPTKYNSFSSLYKTFKKSNISEHDTIIFDITKYFISTK